MLSGSLLFCSLFNRQNIREAGDVEHIHNIGADVFDDHFAAGIHLFLGREDDAKSGGGDVLEVGKIQNKVGHAFQIAAQFRFQSGGGIGVKTTGEGESQSGIGFVFVNLHNGLLLSKYESVDTVEQLQNVRFIGFDFFSALFGF